MKRKILLQFLYPALLIAALSGCGGCGTCDCDSLNTENASLKHQVDSLAPLAESLDFYDCPDCAPPVIPVTGENISVFYGRLSPIYDMPGIYASKTHAGDEFAHIIVAVAHDDSQIWTYSGSADSGDTLVLTYTSSTVGTINAGVSVHVQDLVDVDGNTYIKAVCTGGGSSLANVEHADDESTLASSQGIPILWNQRADATTLQSGGFIYGMINKRPTLNMPVAGSAPADYEWKNSVTNAGTVQYYQYVLYDWPDPNAAEVANKHKSTIYPYTVSGRTAWFVL